MNQKFVMCVIAVFALTFLASCCNHKQTPPNTASTYDSKAMPDSNAHPSGTTGPRGGKKQ